MQTYTIKVCRISYQFAEIEVKAETQEAAEITALDDAGNHTYSEKDVEYKIS